MICPPLTPRTPNKQLEKVFQAKLLQELAVVRIKAESDIKVWCQTGLKRIDVVLLEQNIIIELKVANKYTNGIGQIVRYSRSKRVLDDEGVTTENEFGTARRIIFLLECSVNCIEKKEAKEIFNINVIQNVEFLCEHENYTDLLKKANK